jgi:hypothetical protein
VPRLLFQSQFVHPQRLATHFLHRLHKTKREKIGCHSRSCIAPFTSLSSRELRCIGYIRYQNFFIEVSVPNFSTLVNTFDTSIVMLLTDVEKEGITEVWA